MSDLDQVEQEIVACLETIPADAAAGGWQYDPKRWTKVIKTKLRDLGASKFDARTCATSCPNADEGEWLYDFAWYKMTRGTSGYLTRLDLVMECEWTPNPEMDGDFQKLVQARASHRVWIFQADTFEAIQEYMGRCRTQIEAFEGTQQGDRYLLVGTDGGHTRFVISQYVASQRLA